LTSRCSGQAYMNDFANHFATLSSSRQTILPKRLVEPGPDAQQLLQLLGSAASAPDHGQVLPWRFIVVPAEARGLLADQFAAALVERDAGALPHQVEQAREKAFRSPLLMLVVVDAQRGDPTVDLLERMVSAGCAIQNVLLMATAQGFGSALTSGKALKSEGLRKLFGLTANDHALCFVSVGTVLARKPARTRPVPQDFTSCLTLDHGVVQGLPANPLDSP
jgi:nitroreductase